MRSLIVAALALLLTATPTLAQAVDDPALGGDDTAASAALAGVMGRVVVQGRCQMPLADDGSTCPDRPFPTIVLVRTPDGQQQIAIANTAADGSFSVPLQPGEYLVGTMTADGTPVPLSSILVDVPGDQFVPVTLIIHGPAVVRIP